MEQPMAPFYRWGKLRLGSKKSGPFIRSTTTDASVRAKPAARVQPGAKPVPGTEVGMAEPPRGRVWLTHRLPGHGALERSGAVKKATITAAAGLSGPRCPCESDVKRKLRQGSND